MTERTVGKYKNITHTDNRLEQVASLLRKYPDTFYQDCGYRQSQTARHPASHWTPFHYICFRDPRFRLKLRRKPWSQQSSQCHRCV